MARAEDIEAVREFNRFYTSRLGLTRNGLYKTEHPLAEARVLYELGANGITESSELRTALRIDAGQLSRLLKRMDTSRAARSGVFPPRCPPAAGAADGDGRSGVRDA